MEPVQDTAHWWNVLAAFGPIVTLLAALLAGAVAYAAYRERREADRRAEWWTRAQWALAAALSADSAMAEVGLGVLTVLASSDLAGPEEARILRAAAVRRLGAAPPEHDGGSAPGVTGALGPRTGIPQDPALTAGAARLQLATDRILGLATPAWVREAATK